MVDRARNVLIVLTNLLQMHVKLLQKSNSKNSRTTGDLIGSKISDKIAKVSKSLLQNNSDTIINEHDK